MKEEEDKYNKTMRRRTGRRKGRGEGDENKEEENICFFPYTKLLNMLDNSVKVVTLIMDNKVQ